jgi:phosphomevalonate kinase
MIMVFDPQLLHTNEDRFHKLANVLSQVANLSAQKKIGSNFDISTAVFGTHLYRNILPHKIAALHETTIEQIDELVSVDP